MRKWMSLAALSLAVLLLSLAGLAGCHKPPAEERPPISFDVEPQMPMGTFRDPSGVETAVVAERYLAFLSYAAAQMKESSGKQSGELSSPGVWNETLTLEDGTTMTLRETVQTQARELLLRSMAVEQWMAERGLTLSEATWEKVRSSLGQVQPEGVSVNALVYAVGMLQEAMPKLFFDIYKQGGDYEPPQAALRACFERYFLSYKQILIDFAPVGGDRLSAAEIAAAPGKIAQYQRLYEQCGDFDRVAAFVKGGGTGDFTKFQKPEGFSAWRDLVTAEYGESDFSRALQKTPVGSLLTYNSDGYASLNLRVDPEVGRPDGGSYFENSYGSLITILLRDKTFHGDFDAALLASLPPTLEELLAQRQAQCALTLDAAWVAKLDPMTWYVQ